MNQIAYRAGRALGARVASIAKARFEQSFSSSLLRAFWSGIHQSLHEAHNRPLPVTDWERLAFEHHTARVIAETARMETRDKLIATSKELSALKRTKNDAGSLRGDPQAANLLVKGSTPSRVSTPTTEPGDA